MSIQKIKVLIVDDQRSKIKEIAEQLKLSGVDIRNIETSGSVSEARAILENRKIDLLILDICIPSQIDSDPHIDAGIDFVNEITEFGESLNAPSYIICVTALTEEYETISDRLEDNLWQLIKYDKSNNSWKKRLTDAVKFLDKAQSKSKSKTYLYDVLIICALEDLELGAVRNVFGDPEERWVNNSIKYLHYELNINGKVFYIAAASQKRMGMVPTAIVSTILINELTPRFITMVGICGAYEKYTNLGDIVIADPVWEYQFGKIVHLDEGEKFQPTIDQYRIDDAILSHIKDVISNQDLMYKIEKAAPKPKPDSRLKSHIGPFVTGSAVIASLNYAERIREQTRNIHAIDMEMFGIYAAAYMSSEPRPKVFGMKSVSDFANNHKNDDYQEYCAYVSARLLYEFLLIKLPYL